MTITVLPCASVTMASSISASLAGSRLAVASSRISSGRVFQIGAGERNSLDLAAGQAGAVIADMAYRNLAAGPE